MRHWIVLLLLACTALAGCTEGNDSDSLSGEPDDAPVDDAPEAPAPPENLAPIARILVNGAEVTDALEVEGSTEFAFDGSTSTDPEGAPLSYDWAVDGVAAGDAASFVRTLAVGDHIISLTVTDAEGLEDAARVDIRVMAPPPPPPPIVYLFDDAENPLAWHTTNSPYVSTYPIPSGVPDHLTAEAAPHLNEWHTTTSQAASGDASWTMVREAPSPVPEGTWQGYADMEILNMTSPAVLVSGASAELSFRAGGDSEPVDGEGLLIRVSIDAGKTWETLDQINGPVDLWTTYRYDVSHVVGETVLLQFQFISDLSCSQTTPIPQGEPAEFPLCGGEGGNYLGYYVDEILFKERG